MLPNEELTVKAHLQYELQKAKARKAYALARRLGFSPIEARVMTSWKKDRIERYASERAESKVE